MTVVEETAPAAGTEVETARQVAGLLVEAGDALLTSLVAAPVIGGAGDRGRVADIAGAVAAYADEAAELIKPFGAEGPEGPTTEFYRLVERKSRRLGADLVGHCPAIVSGEAGSEQIQRWLSKATNELYGVAHIVADAAGLGILPCIGCGGGH